MPIVINTNAAASSASFNLSKNAEALRKSLSRLSSGNRITQPAEDAGGLAVAYKLDSHIKRSDAVLNNHQNALSYLQVQDGALETVGKVVNRMSELRTMAADVTKNASDIENYSKEFRELQMQLKQMQREKFNGISIFTIDSTTVQTSSLESAVASTYDYVDENGQDQTYNYNSYARSLKTHPSGVAGDGEIKLNVVNLQSVLTMVSLGTANLGGFVADSNNATSGFTDGIFQKIDNISSRNFNHVIEKIADARAENGAEQQRVQQSYEFHQINRVNLEAAHGRIMDVDVALESTRFAKNNVLVQASASMTAQANQLTQVALTLLQ
jgi:flagellin